MISSSVWLSLGMRFVYRIGVYECGGFSGSSEAVQVRDLTLDLDVHVQGRLTSRRSPLVLRDDELANLEPKSRILAVLLAGPGQGIVDRIQCHQPLDLGLDVDRIF